jgi:hypothetical protein
MLFQGRPGASAAVFPRSGMGTANGMGYVIAGILVLLLVAGFVTFFVINATKKSGRAAPSDPGADGTPAGIASPDPSPLGDTTQHSGDQREGQTVTDTESADGGDAGHRDRPRVGDPGPEAQRPESERLANRPR